MLAAHHRISLLGKNQSIRKLTVMAQAQKTPIYDLVLKGKAGEPYKLGDWWVFISS